ncbi:neuronal acetylcholine receptor subunit alpha-6-like [Patiria miniata]|uniref:Uncharacterized protein n=1 Tax=Patiria miniata TaxID=46514 RepID=A0A914ALZ2_PATMI|nr:neuronal acetylcholine receptor subunit alpha-6-like [Patiria miniata]
MCNYAVAVSLQSDVMASGLVTLWWLLSFLVLTTARSSIAHNASASYLTETRLRQLIVRGNGIYDMLGRPATAPNHSVVVDLALNMYGLISMDEKAQVMTAASWLKLTWHDYRARWDPMDYDNITHLSLGQSEIWTPKILLTNEASDRIHNPVPESVFLALLKWDGTVELQGPVIHKTHCAMQLSEFPFDRQTCGLIFASQNMPRDMMTLRPGASQMNNLEITSQWRPLGLVGNVVEYVFDSQTYHALLVEFTAERLPHYNLMNVALPSGAMAFISLWVFWLPPESGEKVSMAVSMLLGQAVFWLVVIESLPITGGQGTPILLSSIESNFLVGGLAILLSVVTVRVHHRPGPLRGCLLRTVFLRVLPVVVCVTRAGTGREVDVSDSPTPTDAKYTHAVDDDAVETLALPDGKAQGVPTSTGDRFSVKVAELESREDPHSCFKAIKDENDSEDMKLVAAVLDRFFFVIAAVLFINGNLPLIVKWMSM